MPVKHASPFGHDQMLEAEPSGGKCAFFVRWMKYLDSLAFAPNQVLKNEAQDTWVEFIVGRDGEIMNTDTSAYRASLTGFLETEQKWMPGVYNGRPFLSRVQLPLLMNSDRKTARFVNLRTDKYSNLFKKKKVFEAIGPGQVNGRKINLVSVVRDEGKHTAPVIHKGDIAQCNELIALLLSLDAQPTYPWNFSRQYFYSDMN